MHMVPGELIKIKLITAIYNASYSIDPGRYDILI